MNSRVHAFDLSRLHHLGRNASAGGNMTQQVLDAIYYEEEAKVNATNELHGLVKPNSNSSEKRSAVKQPRLASPLFGNSQNRKELTEPITKEKAIRDFFLVS